MCTACSLLVNTNIVRRMLLDEHASSVEAAPDVFFISLILLYSRCQIGRALTGRIYCI